VRQVLKNQIAAGRNRLGFVIVDALELTTATIRSEALLDGTNTGTCFDNVLKSRQGRRRRERIHIYRGRLQRVGTAEAGHRKCSILIDIPYADPLRITQCRRQGSGIDLLDLDRPRIFRFIRIPGPRIAERVVQIGISGRIAGLQVRVLEKADIGHEELSIGTQSDPVRIATRTYVSHHGLEVIGLGYLI